MVKVAVVGCGFVGAALGYYLSSLGASVSFFAPIVAASGSASEAAVGISSVKGLLLPETPLFRAKIEGHRLLRGLLSDLNRVSPNSIPTIYGAKEPIYTSEQFNKKWLRIYRAQFTGCYGPIVRQVSKNEDLSFEGRVLTEIFYPEDFWLCPDSFLKCLILQSIARGARFFEKSVQKIFITERGSGLVCDDHESFNDFDHVVVCAGIDSLGIAEKSGFRLPTIVPVPGYSFHLTLDRNIRSEAKVSGLYSGVIDALRFVIGSVDGYPESNKTQAKLEQITDLLGWQDLTNKRIGEKHTYRWGVRCRTRKRNPLIANFEHQGSSLLFVTGMYKSGLQLSPLLGQYLAQRLTKQPVNQGWNYLKDFETSLVRKHNL